jgi:hypothetical protein
MATTAPDRPSGHHHGPTIPFDEYAESQIVGLVVASASDAGLAAGQVESDEFYRPAFGHAFDTAGQITAISEQWRRVNIVAEGTGLRAQELAALVDDACPPVGRWCRRVRIAARRRRIMALAADLYNTAATATREDLAEFASDLALEVELIQAEGSVTISPESGRRAGSVPALGAFRASRQVTP